MSWRRDKTLWGLTLGLAGLLLLNFVVPEWFRSILTLSLARGSVALGLLVLWRCGLISFGHALYFGFGAYTVGLMGRYLGITDAFLTIACGVATAGLLAFLLGFLLRQYRGIFFALLNMAFSMILYGVLAKLEELGSTDGISLEVTTYLWYAPLGAENKTALFIFAAILTWGVAVLVHLYLRSTLGNMTTAVRENEIRLGYLGYSGERAVHAKYVISGLVGGFGGAIAALTIGHVDPDSMAYWPVSGDFVFIAILSGTGNVVAPFIGALMYELIRTYAFDLFPGHLAVDHGRNAAGHHHVPAERPVVAGGPAAQQGWGACAPGGKGRGIAGHVPWSWKSTISRSPSARWWPPTTSTSWWRKARPLALSAPTARARLPSSTW